MLCMGGTPRPTSARGIRGGHEQARVFPPCRAANVGQIAKEQPRVFHSQLL
jgi:hypothetical protein